MIQQMFSALIILFFIGAVFYTAYFNKKAVPPLIVISAVSLVLINLVDWRYSAISLILLTATVILKKKLDYASLFIYSILGAILCSFFLLQLYLNFDSDILTTVGIFSVIIICALGILGILENDLKKYLIYSNFIQLTFVFLDLSVAELTGKISTLGVIQIFNYVIAGVLLFATLGILIRENRYNKINELRGLYYQDKATGVFAIIAAMSLAGVPGLNIFVSEWLLFKTSFGINPAITILGIFAALVLFIMYFKIVYILLSGEPRKGESSPLIFKIYNGILAFACIVFGVLPFTQFYILEKII